MNAPLVHEHLIVRANIKNPPTDTALLEQWLRDLVAAINMKILMGPYVVYSDMVGNRGITGVAVIETSHIALHVWDECDPGMLQLDVFSCAPVDIDTVLSFIEQFQPEHVDYKFFDRNGDYIKIL